MLQSRKLMIAAGFSLFWIGARKLARIFKLCKFSLSNGLFICSKECREWFIFPRILLTILQDFPNMCLITAVIDFFWRVWECRGGGVQFSFNFPNVIGGRGEERVYLIELFRKILLIKIINFPYLMYFFFIYTCILSLKL